MTGAPWLWLVAGPNGAGKSTRASNMSSDVEEIVTPDAAAHAPVMSGRLAIKRIRRLIEERRSFAVETTLSGRLQLEMAARAKATGWKVGITYIGLSSPNLAVERVGQRRLKGGHNVPAVDIRRRYSRSLKHLAEVYRIANRVVVFDNSSARKPTMKRVLEARDGLIIFKLKSLPKWLRVVLDPVLKEQRG
jgi:predicted ABC-type ATPase